MGICPLRAFDRTRPLPIQLCTCPRYSISNRQTVCRNHLSPRLRRRRISRKYQRRSGFGVGSNAQKDHQQYSQLEAQEERSQGYEWHHYHLQSSRHFRLSGGYCTEDATGETVVLRDLLRRQCTCGLGQNSEGNHSPYCAVCKIGGTPIGTAQSGGESEEGRRPTPLGRGPGGGPSPCGPPCARARAFPTNGAARGRWSHLSALRSRSSRRLMEG